MSNYSSSWLAIGCAALLLHSCDTGAKQSEYLLDDGGDRGVGFSHRTGGMGNRELPEAMGGGVALIDFDRDGDFDLYFSQSGPMRPAEGLRRKGSRNELYSNDGHGYFTQVRGAAGAADPAYGQALAVGDIDGDGWDDLLSLNWGANRLYRNSKGQFESVELDQFSKWSLGATFFDAEGDGDLDLYVVNYLACEPGSFVRLGDPSGFESYPHPDRYFGEQDQFFVNDGAGTYEERTQAAGFEVVLGKGLGVVATDCDLDGLLDLYVANDSAPNLLFHNAGGLRFDEVGQRWGVAFNEDGRSEAGMGVDSGDLDEDGDFDLFVTNLDQETNTLYENQFNRKPSGHVGNDEILFRDVTRFSGTARASRPLVGFGALLSDIDGNGHLDIMVVNGHIIDNIDQFTDMESYPQGNHVFLDQGDGRFQLAEPNDVGPAVFVPTVSRGLACGDLDGDGDLDYVLGSIGGGIQLLFGNPRWDRWLSLSLAGPSGNPHGLGASLRLCLEDGSSLLRRIESSRSYASASAPILVTGLPAKVLAVDVLWPGGQSERFETASGPDYSKWRELKYGEGSVAPFVHR